MVSGAIGNLLAKRGGRHGFLTGRREVGSAKARVERLVDAVSDGVGSLGLTELIEQKGGAEKGADGVGPVRAGDVRGAAVNRLEEAHLAPHAGGGEEAQGAGQDVANPIGTILSAALLLDELGEPEAADAVRHGVNATLEAEFRTADLASSEEEAVSTPAFGREVANRAAKRAPQNMSLSSEKA